MRVLSLGLSYCLLSVRNHLPSSLLTAVAFHVVVHPRACSCIQFHTCTLQPERVRKERKEKKRKEREEAGEHTSGGHNLRLSGYCIEWVVVHRNVLYNRIPTPPKKKINTLFVYYYWWLGKTYLDMLGYTHHMAPVALRERQESDSEFHLHLQGATHTMPSAWRYGGRQG